MFLFKKKKKNLIWKRLRLKNNRMIKPDYVFEVGLLVIIICWGQRLNVFQICQDFPDDCLGFILRRAPKYPMLVNAQSPAFQTQLPRHSDWQVKAFLESRKGESVAKAEIKSGSAWKQWPEVNLSASLFLSKDFHSSLKVSSLHFAIIVVEIFTFIATASDF